MRQKSVAKVVIQRRFISLAVYVGKICLGFHYSWFLGPKDGILSSQFTIPMRLNLGRNLGHRQEKTVYRRFRQIKSMAAVLSVSKGEEAFISHLKRKQRAESDRRPRRTLALTTVTSSYIFFTLRKTCRNIDLQFSWLRHHLTWKEEGNIRWSKEDLLGHGRWQIRQNQAKWRFPLGSFIKKK